TLNGSPVVVGTAAGNVQITSSTVPVGSGLVVNADGTVTVPANTPSGNYSVSYTICEVNNPLNCSTISSTVVVSAPAIVAVTETTPSVNGLPGGTTTALTGNDTLNGSPVVVGTAAGNVQITSSTVPVGSGLVVNADGTVTVPANTPSGNYSVSYTICEVNNPLNCSTISSTVVVSAPAIVAVTETTPSVNGLPGGTTTALTGNDTLNGSPVVVGTAAGNVQITSSTVPVGSGLVVNADGTVTVPANTPSGNYSVSYTICEVNNPLNCSTISSTVVVSAPAIVEVPSIAIIKTAVFNDENSNGNADAGETITYNFKVTNTGNVPLYNITVLDPLAGIIMSGGPIDLNVNDTDEVSFSAQYSITQNDINNGSISNQASVMGSTLSGIKVEDKSDNINNLGDNPTVLLLSGCVIKIFNAVSINGDSMNERFYIQGIECYPDNTVQIYNRWGVLVFERDHYNNTDVAFRGISEGRVTIKESKGLPEGTYYYIIKYKDHQSTPHQEAGYLYLTK
ncbi:T9SS type B sorting domain-containing protein, partial [Flavobacterium tructae]